MTQERASTADYSNLAFFPVSKSKTFCERKEPQDLGTTPVILATLHRLVHKIEALGQWRNKWSAVLQFSYTVHTEMHKFNLGCFYLITLAVLISMSQ